MVQASEPGFQSTTRADAIADTGSNLRYGQYRGKFQSECCTYNDAGPGEHLAETRRGIDGERTLKEVLGVEASIVVDTGAAGGALNGRRKLDDGGGRDRGLRSKEVESRHDGVGLERRLKGWMK